MYAPPGLNVLEIHYEFRGHMLRGSEANVGIDFI